jgi:hypothetical protein
MDASATDADGTIVQYLWSIDGSAAGDSGHLERSFTSYGRHTLRLEVVDNEGEANASDGEVWVHARPVARMTGPTRADRVSPVELDGASSDDADGTVSTWRWNVSDGARPTGARITHRFTSVGVHTVALQVIDNDGFAGDAFLTVDVVNIRPEVQLEEGPTLVNLDQPFVLRVLATDADGPMPTVHWSIDGVAVGDGAEIIANVSLRGEHSLEAVATDADGGSAYANATFHAIETLGATVTTTQRSYSIDKPIEGDVRVRHADGAPVSVALVHLRVLYHPPSVSGAPAVLLREIDATTDTEGIYRFRLEDVWPETAPRALLPRIRPPTENCATYEIGLYTSWRSNVGEDSTHFRVVVSERTAPLCGRIQSETAFP